MAGHDWQEQRFLRLQEHVLRLERRLDAVLMVAAVLLLLALTVAVTLFGVHVARTN